MVSPGTSRAVDSPSCAAVPTSSPCSTTWPAGWPPSTTPARCSTRWPARRGGSWASTSPTSCCCAPDRLRIEVVDGAMGSAMRGIELEAGQGLGGQVLATGRPLWSESYLDGHPLPAPAGHRLRRAERAARRHPRRAAASSGDDTLGVLLAAERRPRAFVDHDVELLAGLAAHAALALRTADLFDRERAGGRRAAGGQRGAARGEREPPARERPARRPQRGRASAAAGSRRSSTRSTARPGWPWRCATPTAGRWPASGSPRRPRRAGRPARGPRRGPGRRVRPPRPTRRPCGCCGSGPRRWPCCWPPSGRWPRPSCAPAASSCTRCCPPTPTRRAWCAGPGRSASTCTRSARWPSSTPSRGPRPPRRSPPASAADLRGWSAAHAGQVVVLVPPASEDARDGRRPALRAGRRRPRPGSPPAPGGPGGVRAAYEEARQTAALLLALDRAGTCAVSDDLGLYRSLFSRSGRAELATFVRGDRRPAARPRPRAPARPRATLETYLEQARHHARTCEVAAHPPQHALPAPRPHHRGARPAVEGARPRPRAPGGAAPAPAAGRTARLTGPGPVGPRPGRSPWQSGDVQSP